MAVARSPKTIRADWTLVYIVIVFVVISLVTVYSASYGYAFMEGGMYAGAPAHFLLRQAAFAVAGLVAMWVFSRIDYRLYRRHALLLVGGTVLVLSIMAFFGRWIVNRPGVQSVQPMEAAKVGALIYIAVWLEAKGEQVRNFNLGLIPFALILGIITGLILIQKDFSSAVLLAVSATTMFFVAGADLKQCLVIIIFAAVASLLVIYVIGYNLERLVAFGEGPFEDVQDSNYQIVRSLAALYRGKLMGVGLGQSEQKYLLYAAHTDCVFAIIGEEFGFLGSLLIVGLYGIWTWCGLRIAAGASDVYGSLLAVGIVAWVTSQAILHVAVVTATTPFTGTVLPMISYGGSSLMASLGSVGVLLNISSRARAASGAAETSAV